MKTYRINFLISRIHTFFLFSTSPFNLTSSSMQACSLGVQLVGQLLGQANMLCILQTSKLDLVCHLHCITDWIIKARKNIIQQEMTQTFLYNLARLGLASSLPGLALTTYLPYSRVSHSTKQILFFLGFEQLRHDVLIIISASCLGSSKF